MDKQPQVTFKKQFFKLLRQNVLCTLAIGIIGLLIFFPLYGIKYADKVLGTFIFLLYALFLYQNARSIAEYDLKSYSTTKAYPYKGFLLSLAMPTLNLIVWLLMEFLQTLTPVGAQIPSVATIAGNAVFLIWTFAYNELFSVNVTNVYWYVHIAMYLTPVFFTTLGYFAGYKKWDLSGRFDFLVYEKKKK